MPITLAYGRERPATRIARQLRMYGLLALAGSLAVLAYSQRERIVLPFQRVYWQSRLATDRPAQVVFVDKPLRGRTIDPRFREVMLPRNWQMFAGAGFPSSNPVVYLGIRHAIGADDRLVMVTRKEPTFSLYIASPIELCAQVYEPAKLVSSAKLIQKGTPVVAAVRGYDPLRIYAGVSDETRPDRFEIEYRVGDDAIVIIGQLNMDDTVTLTVPALPPVRAVSPVVPMATLPWKRAGDPPVVDVIPAATTQPHPARKKGKYDPEKVNREIADQVIHGPTFATAPDRR